MKWNSRLLAAAGVINDALLEQGWKFTTESVESWVSSFVQRRYASTSADLQQAWAILTNQSETSVYNGPRGRYFASWGNTVSGRRIYIRKYERRLTLAHFVSGTWRRAVRSGPPAPPRNSTRGFPRAMASWDPRRGKQQQSTETQESLNVLTLVQSVVTLGGSDDRRVESGVSTVTTRSS